MLSFKPAVLLSSFTFIKRLFGSSSLDFLFPGLPGKPLICTLFEDGRPDCCEVVPRWVLTCIPLIVRDAEHLFTCLLKIWIFLQRNIYLGLLPVFWLGCFFLVIEMFELFVCFGTCTLFITLLAKISSHSVSYLFLFLYISIQRW